MHSVIDCCMHNRANTLSMLACLEACREQRPYREVEAEVDALPVMDMTTQNAHALIKALIEANGIKKTEVPEENEASASEQRANEEHSPNWEEEPVDQPVDYLLQITQEGLDALNELSSEKRFADLIAAEPEGYRDAYARILESCLAPQMLADINASLEGHSALMNPKRIYPEYFVSKLETIGGLTWEGAWRTTEAGRQMLETIRATKETPQSDPSV